MERDLSHQFGVSRSAIRQAPLTPGDPSLVKVGRRACGGACPTLRLTQNAPATATSDVDRADSAASAALVGAAKVPVVADGGHVHVRSHG